MKNMKKRFRFACAATAAAMVLGLCGRASGSAGNKKAPEDLNAPERAIDSNGRAAVGYCETPDEAWDYIKPFSPKLKSSDKVTATVSYKLLWNDGGLNILAEVTDPDVSPKDGVTLYLNELGHTVGTSVKTLTVYSGGSLTGIDGAEATAEATKSGYILKITVPTEYSLSNGVIMGMELELCDFDSASNELGKVNLFVKSNESANDINALGKCILSGRESGGSAETRLERLISDAESIDLSQYLTSGIMRRAVKNAEAAADLPGEETEKAMADIQTAFDCLFDESGFPNPAELERDKNIPDPFTYLDGSTVKNAAEWPKRAAEINAMYQHYMYGVWRDGSDEELSYSYKDGSLTMTIKRISTGAETSFKATIKLPDVGLTAPEGGYPVIVGMHQGISEDTANAKGYATITVDGFSIPVASDDTKRVGAFYDLYPYDRTNPKEQTGVLMAWSWGCSKVLDALEQGLGAELNISAENTIVTGVSRWGKAAMVCGAFEPRFKMVAPSCSGAGGVALFRYVSEGKTYDFSSKDVPDPYTYGQNEPLGSLQSSGERGWFNELFCKFKFADALPFDQHMLSSLAADKDRYLFIIGSCVYEDWVNAPAMWYSYLGAAKVYESLGIADNIAVNIHKQGHAVIEEDVEYMTDYFNYHVYGIEPKLNLDDLKTSVFALDMNTDPDMEGFADWWMTP